MDLLYEMFPKAKFIHIVRDGRDVFFSWRKMDPNKSHPSVMAMDWRLKTRFIEQSMKTIPQSNILIIRYEDLLQEPELRVKEICDFLDIKFQKEMLKFHKSSTKYIGKHHSDLIFKAIDSSNINKWEKNLKEVDETLFDSHKC